MLSLLFTIYLKMLVLYSPFFVLSCFIGLTPGYSTRERKRLAWKVALGTLIASVLLYLFGKTIFEIFGITADAFRIGAGSVLYLALLATRPRQQEHLHASVSQGGDQAAGGQRLVVRMGVHEQDAASAPQQFRTHNAPH